MHAVERITVGSTLHVTLTTFKNTFIYDLLTTRSNCKWYTTKPAVDCSGVVALPSTSMYTLATLMSSLWTIANFGATISSQVLVQ